MIHQLSVAESRSSGNMGYGKELLFFGPQGGLRTCRLRFSESQIVVVLKFLEVGVSIRDLMRKVTVT